MQDLQHSAAQRSAENIFAVPAHELLQPVFFSKSTVYMYIFRVLPIKNRQSIRNIGHLGLQIYDRVPIYPKRQLKKNFSSLGSK